MEDEEKESATILITGHVEKELALEFKALLSEHGQQSQAIRKFVRVFVMMAREKRKNEERIVVVDEAAHEAAKKILGE